MTDELYRDVRCPHAVTLPVLGVSTTFSANTPELLGIVERCYGLWRVISNEAGLVSSSSAEVRLILHDAPGSDANVPELTYRLPDPTRLVVTTPSSFGIADTARLQSVVYVDASLLAHPDVLVEGVIEPMTLFLLGALDRQPIHGTAIWRGDVALVLAGPSGVGKTTLTYAAQRGGFTPLGDEPVFVQMEPELRVWCRMAPIRLPPEARAHFPELADMEPTTLSNGKSKILIDAGGSARRHADRVGLCLLQKGEGRSPTLVSMSPDQAADHVVSHPEQGYDLYAATLHERIRRVAQGGAWTLRVAGTPHDAIPLFEEMFESLERTP